MQYSVTGLVRAATGGGFEGIALGRLAPLQGNVAESPDPQLDGNFGGQRGFLRV